MGISEEEKEGRSVHEYGNMMKREKLEIWSWWWLEHTKPASLIGRLLLQRWFKNRRWDLVLPFSFLNFILGTLVYKTFNDSFIRKTFHHHTLSCFAPPLSLGESSHPLTPQWPYSY